jgi:hypothetical protein
MRVSSSFRLALTLSIVLIGAAARAADRPPEPGALFAAVRAAIAQNTVEYTKLVGVETENTTFKDLPKDGGVLVGFDVGLGKFVNDFTIKAIRPVYLKADGQVVSLSYGAVNRQRPGVRNSEPTIVKWMSVRAKPGYAVGMVEFRMGLNLDSLRVTFQKLVGTTLDLDQAYTTAWIGRKEGKKPHVLDADGSPIVGVFGNHDDERIMALGFVCLPPPPPPGVPVNALPGQPQAAPQPGGKPAVPAELPPRTYINGHQHFSFVLPDSWVEMQPKELEQAHAFLKQHLSGLKIEYDTGLRQRGARPWSYPYVLIQITPMPPGEVSYEEVEEHLRDDLPGALKQVTGTLGDMIRNTAINSAVLDRDRNLILIRMQMDVPGFGSIHGVSFSYLGKKSVIGLHCYALGDDFERLLPTFTEMSKSFKFDEGFTFHPAPPRKSVFDAVWLLPTILGVVALGLVAGAFLFLWRGKAPIEPVRPLWEEPEERDAPVELGEALPAEDITAKPPPPASPAKRLATPAALDVPKLPFFTATETMTAEHHAYRVYFLPNELLFLDCGPTANTGSAASAIQEGLAGGLKEQVRRRQWQMNLASPEEILEMAELSPHSFRAAEADMVNARIEPPGFFEKLDKSVAGWFRFEHRERGNIDLQIQSMDDMRLATKLLPAGFGETVAVNVELDRQGWRYVKRSDGP